MQIARWKLNTLPIVMILSALLLLIGSTAAWYVRSLYQDLSTVLELNVASVRAAEELELIHREMRTQLNRVLYHQSHEDLTAVLALQPEAERWIDESERLATTPHEQELMKQISRGHDRLLSGLLALREEEDLHRAAGPLKILIEDVLTIEILGPARAYLDYNEETMVSVAQQHRVLSGRFSWVLLVCGISGSLGGLLAGVQATRRLRRSIVELNLPLSVTAGKLSEVAGPVRLATFLDFDELKRVLETIAGEVERVVGELQKSQAEVLRSEKFAAIGQLAAGTAHEIRNPLMAIKLLVQAALSQKKTEEALTRADLELIVREISRVETTVRNLLDFAKPIRATRRRLRFGELLPYCLSLVGGRAAIQGVQLISDLPENEPWMEGDFEQLHQVILNLLLNALDASAEGASITMRVERVGFSDLKLSVIDQGRGIPSDLLPRIFEPFTSSKDSGTGLGLSISKKIVEAHGGEIFAYNRPEGGAIVGFSLPLSPTEEP